MLECPICCDLIGPPIHQCESGHLLCSTCYNRPTLLQCPCCRVQLNKILPVRNLSLERIAELSELKFACKYQQEGCDDKFRGKQKEKHEAKCDFRDFQCPFDGCDEINIRNIRKHFVDFHYQEERKEIEYRQGSNESWEDWDPEVTPEDLMVFAKCEDGDVKIDARHFSPRKESAHYRLSLKAQREEHQPFKLTFTENALSIHSEENEIDEGKFLGTLFGI